jgi:serine/threonine-protein kinase RsbW
MKQVIYRTNVDLRSNKKAIKLIEPIIFEVKERLNLPDDKFYNILIAVTEAVNNGIIHGNKLNPAKYVHFTILADLNEIEIIVEDEGEGFDHEGVVDPRQPENLLKENGRGVFLIKALCDSCDYESNNTGTRLVMRWSCINPNCDCQNSEN